MNTFLQMVEAIEENNRLNDGKWSDWESITNMEEIYGKLECDYRETAINFLDSCIQNNGENVELFIHAMDCLEYGKPFHRARNTYIRMIS